MKVESIVLGSIGTNCYIVTNEETKECFAVDMAECPQEYVNYIKNNGLEMKALFLTHGHFDHIMGIDDFLKAFLFRQSSQIHKYALILFDAKFLSDNIS